MSSSGGPHETWSVTRWVVRDMVCHQEGHTTFKVTFHWVCHSENPISRSLLTTASRQSHEQLKTVAKFPSIHIMSFCVRKGRQKTCPYKETSWNVHGWNGIDHMACFMYVDNSILLFYPYSIPNSAATEEATGIIFYFPLKESICFLCSTHACTFIKEWGALKAVNLCQVS